MRFWRIAAVVGVALAGWGLATPSRADVLPVVAGAGKANVTCAEGWYCVVTLNGVFSVGTTRAVAKVRSSTFHVDAGCHQSGCDGFTDAFTLSTITTDGELVSGTCERSEWSTSSEDVSYADWGDAVRCVISVGSQGPARAKLDVASGLDPDPLGLTGPYPYGYYTLTNRTPGSAGTPYPPPLG